MRIACISAAQIPSDTANSIQVMKVCQAFSQLGLDVTLLVPDTGQPRMDERHLAERYGLENLFPIQRLSSNSRRWFPWKAVLEVRRMKAGLIYAWPLQAATLGLAAGIPAMLELHDFPTGTVGPLWLRLFLALPGHKRLLPITKALGNALRLPEELTIVAPDGVDLERYTSLPDPESTRRVLGLPEALTVLCTGHLYAGRGVGLFLELAADFPLASFVWVGGRPADVEEWRTRAAGLPNIRFTGFVPNERIPLYQAAAEVLLMPYQRTVATSSGGNTAEICSPMKMFEYMAAGRTILSSDLAVLHEVLDETMAVFCPVDDIKAWRTALGELLNDEKRRKALGKHARAAVEQYSWVKRAQRVLDGFYEISA